MLYRFVGAAAGLAAMLTLSACNETAGPAAAGPALSTPIAPSAYRLAPGSPCANEINQYHAIVKADLETGNVEKKVYDQIDTELTNAAAACSSGMGGKAHSLVAASKARHGYRA